MTCIHSFNHIHTIHIYPSPVAEVFLHLFIAGTLSGKNLPVVPSRESNSGLPYSKPTRYQLSHAAPAAATATLTFKLNPTTANSELFLSPLCEFSPHLLLTQENLFCKCFGAVIVPCGCTSFPGLFRLSGFSVILAFRRSSFPGVRAFLAFWVGRITR